MSSMNLPVSQSSAQFFQDENPQNSPPVFYGALWPNSGRSNTYAPIYKGQSIERKNLKKFTHIPQHFFYSLIFFQLSEPVFGRVTGRRKTVRYRRNAWGNRPRSNTFGGYCTLLCNFFFFKWRSKAEFERERKRWIEEEMRNKKQDEDNLKRQEDKWRREIQASTKLLQAEVETLKQQHSEQIAALKKTWDEDKREELAALRHTLEVKTNERERQLVESRRKEREEDAQNFARHLAEELQRQHVSFLVKILWLLIHRLIVQEEQKMLTEQQVQRIREKHSEELASSDRVESELRNKLTEIRRQLTDRDEELATLRMSLFQHLKENKDMKKLLEQYTGERTDLKGALQKELEMEFRRLEEEKRELLDELSTLKFEHRRDISRANAEISNMTASHEKMLADIHERVRSCSTVNLQNVGPIRFELD